MRFQVCLGMLLLLVVLGAFTAAAMPDTSLKLVVKDIATNNRIGSLPVLVQLTNIRTGAVEKTSEYIDAQGELTYRLEPGDWRLELEIFDPKTESITHYGQRAIYIQESEPVLNRSFYMTPVGSLEGVVVHDDGKLAGQAALDFHCSFASQFEYPARTDQFGSFKLLFVPAGTCRITASTNDRVGSSEINITAGEAKTVKVVLDQSAASVHLSTSIAWVIAGAGVVIVFLVGYSLLRRRLKSELKEEFTPKARFARKILRKIKARTEHKQENQHQEKKETLNPRARDILQTLNPREKATVEFLVGQKNNQATQAQLRNNTSIPKTSLARVFQSLEHKKVITVEKIGKMKKVTLTPWFLGKE
ncbi:MAG: hypothetical protein Q7R76_05300 [Candidatus Woesearchaeota archaeon]|nr:hypothetical protein [Candidatus Woesearchaeota archaeon]